MTSRQIAIIDYIKAYTAANGCPPTNREIAQGIGLASVSTVAEHLQRMRNARMVDWKDRCARTIRVTQ